MRSLGHSSEPDRTCTEGQRIWREPNPGFFGCHGICANAISFFWIAFCESQTLHWLPAQFGCAKKGLPCPRLWCRAPSHMLNKIVSHAARFAWTSRSHSSKPDSLPGFAQAKTSHVLSLMRSFSVLVKGCVSIQYIVQEHKAENHTKSVALYPRPEGRGFTVTGDKKPFNSPLTNLLICVSEAITFFVAFRRLRILLFFNLFFHWRFFKSSFNLLEHP